MLRGAAATPPDRLVIGRWQGLHGSLWDYTIDPSAAITSNGQYATYWNPAALAPGQSRTYTTYYGLGDVTVDLVPPLALGLSGPTSLSAARRGFPEPLRHHGYRLQQDCHAARDVRATLNLPAGLSARESTVSPIGDLPAGSGERVVSWTVTAAPQNRATTLNYSVTVATTGAAPKTLSRALQVPATTSATDCSHPFFIGLRGSGEENRNNPNSPTTPTGMGRTINFLYLDVQTKLGRPLDKIDRNDQINNYDAVPVGPEALLHYKQSGGGGTKLALDQLRARIAKCKTATKVVMAGYLQGAQAVSDALRQMTSDQRKTVVGVVMFGNPLHTPFLNGDAGPNHAGIGLFAPVGPLPDGLPKRMQDYCYWNDPVCGGGPVPDSLFNLLPKIQFGSLAVIATELGACKLQKITCTHSNYLGSNEDAAAAFLVSKLK